MTDRMTTEEMLTRAGRAVGKIDRHGARGVTYVTFDEIEAMAAALACLGVPALRDDAVIEDPAFVSRRFDPAHSTPIETPVQQEMNDD